jgi:hypothetical protein
MPRPEGDGHISFLVLGKLAWCWDTRSNLDPADVVAALGIGRIGLPSSGRRLGSDTVLLEFGFSLAASVVTAGPRYAALGP